MKNIEKYNKYYGKSYDVRKIIYFVIFLALLITFFFGPIGRADTNVDITNNSPTTNQQNEPPIIPLLPNQQTAPP